MIFLEFNSYFTLVCPTVMWFQCNQPITGAEGSFKKEAMFKTESTSDDPEFSTSVKTENDEHKCDKKEFINKPTNFVCPQCCTSFLDIEKFLNHIREHHGELHSITSKSDCNVDSSTKLLKNVEKRRRLNYSGTGRDFISVGDIDWGRAEALKKSKAFEKIQPEMIIERLGLIFSDERYKEKAKIKILYHLNKRQRSRTTWMRTEENESPHFFGVNDGILNILAVTTRLDSGHPVLDDPENTLTADQAEPAGSSISVSSTADSVIGTTKGDNSGMSRDFISVDDVKLGIEGAKKKCKWGEKLQPEKVVDELGLIFSDAGDKKRACGRIRSLLDKKRKWKKGIEGIGLDGSSRFFGVDNGILNILAVTTRLDSGHPVLDDPENTPISNQAGSSISVSSIAASVIGTTKEDWDKLEKSSVTRRKQKIAHNLIAVIDEIANSSKGRLSKHAILKEIVKRYEVVKEKPSLDPSSSLIKNPNEVAFD